MTTLDDEAIVEIARKVAVEVDLPASGISTSAALDSFGDPAVNVTYSIAPDASFTFFRDGRSARAVNRVIQEVFGTGEDRLAIVHFEVTGNFEVTGVSGS
jgi:hypothetical protein